MERRLPLWLVLAVVLSVIVVAESSLPAQAADEKDSTAEIEKLIRQLGDDNFDRREEASRRLRGRDDAIAALRKAAKSGDPEVARRATEVLGLYARKDFDRLKGLAKDGRVDEAIEKLVERKKWDDERAAWQVMAELAGTLCDLEKKTFGWASLPDSGIPARDLRRFEATLPPSHPIRFISEPSQLPERISYHDPFLVRVGDISAVKHGVAWTRSFSLMGRTWW